MRSLHDLLVGDMQLSKPIRRYGSFLLLGAAIFLGCLSYTKNGWFFDRHVSLKPDFFSGACAIGIVAAIYFRRILPFSLSLYAIISFALNVTVTAIVVQGLLGQTATWLTNWQIQYILPFVALMSWLGIRPLVPVLWLAVIALGIVNLQSMSAVMGANGFYFAIFAVLGLLLQLDLDAARLRNEISFELFGVDREHLGRPAQGDQCLMPDHQAYYRNVKLVKGNSQGNTGME